MTALHTNPRTSVHSASYGKGPLKFKRLIRKLPLSKERKQVDFVEKRQNTDTCSYETVVSKKSSPSFVGSLPCNEKVGNLITPDRLGSPSEVNVIDRQSTKCSTLLRNIRRSYVRRGSLSASSFTPRKRRCSNNSVSIAGSKRSLVALKFDYDFYERDEDDSSDSDCGGSYCDPWKHKQNKPREYRIQFQSHATVVEVPHRKAYTEEQRKQMWNGSKIIRANAKRNRIEYEWEGYDWREAAEEHEFCENNGEQVHPAHAPVFC